jgi:hypothetical protein
MAFAWQLLSVVMSSAVVGSGIGFIQGEVVARKWTRPEQIAFAEGACMIGGEVAFVIGPLLYFLFFGRKISIEEFFGIVAAALVAGVLSALIVPEWITMFATILSAIVVAALYKEIRKRKPLAGQ